MNKSLSPLQTEHLTAFNASDRTTIWLYSHGNTSAARAACKTHHLRAAYAISKFQQWRFFQIYILNHTIQPGRKKQIEPNLTGKLANLAAWSSLYFPSGHRCAAALQSKLAWPSTNAFIGSSRWMCMKWLELMV